MNAAPASPQTLPIAEIGELHADDYVGLIDPAAIELLTVRLAAEGLLTPIWVRRNGNAAAKCWSVIAGRHRLRAATALGWTEIVAVERAGSGSDADELRALQVAENLDRRVLRPIERACFIMERWREVAMKIEPAAPANQQGAAIRERWSVLAAAANTRVGATAPIDQATAHLVGESARNVRVYRTLYIKLVSGLPDLFARLNAHPLGESMGAISTIANIKNESARRQAAETMLSRLDWKNVEAVMLAAKLEASKGNVTHNAASRVLNGYNRLALAGQRSFGALFADRATPGIAEDFFRRAHHKVTPATAQEIVALWKKSGLLP